MGAASGVGDRVAWTVEVQLHVEAEFAPDGLVVEEIWVQDKDLVTELPDDLRRLARVTPEDEPLEAAVARTIDDRCTRRNA